MSLRNPGCPFCGIAPLDGERCCNESFKRAVLRGADGKLADASKEIDRLRAENAKLRAVYELVANALEQIKQAHKDGLPGKAASFDDEMLKVLADYAPSGEKFSALAKKIRGDLWNNSLLTAAEKENADLRAYRDRTEAALSELTKRLHDYENDGPAIDAYDLQTLELIREPNEKP